MPCKIWQTQFLCLIINLWFFKLDWLKMLDIEGVLLCDLWLNSEIHKMNLASWYPAIFGKQTQSIAVLLLSALRFGCCIWFISDHVIDSPSQEWWTHCLYGWCLWRYMKNCNDNIYQGQEKCSDLQGWLLSNKSRLWVMNSWYGTLCTPKMPKKASSKFAGGVTLQWWACVRYVKV